MIKKIINSEKFKYIIVGIWNTIFSYAAFIALYYSMTKHDIHYTLVLVVSQIVGITNAYICYKVFVFKTKGNIVREYLKFYVVYGSTLAVNFILILILVELGGLNPVISQGLIAIVVVIMAYIGHVKFSFNNPK